MNCSHTHHTFLRTQQILDSFSIYDLRRWICWKITHVSTNMCNVLLVELQQQQHPLSSSSSLLYSLTVTRCFSFTIQSPVNIRAWNSNDDHLWADWRWRSLTLSNCSLSLHCIESLSMLQRECFSLELPTQLFDQSIVFEGEIENPFEKKRRS